MKTDKNNKLICLIYVADMFDICCSASLNSKYLSKLTAMMFLFVFLFVFMF